MAEAGSLQRRGHLPGYGAAHDTVHGFFGPPFSPHTYFHTRTFSLDIFELDFMILMSFCALFLWRDF